MKRLLLVSVVAVIAVSFTSGLQAQTSPTKTQAAKGMSKQPRVMQRAGGGCTSRRAQMSGKPC